MARQGRQRLPRGYRVARALARLHRPPADPNLRLLLFTMPFEPMKIANVAAGDVLLSSNLGRRSWSWLIQLVTFSRFSHAAMVIDDNGTVVEALKKEGVRTVGLDRFLQENKRVWVLRAPEPFGPQAQAHLKQIVKTHTGKKYDALRAANAGVSPLAWVAQFGLVGAALYWGIKGNLFHTLSWGMPVLFFSTCLVAVGSQPKLYNNAVRRFGLPACFENNMEAQYCSRVVMELLLQLGHREFERDFEPRPEDIYRVLKGKGYPLEQLKPTKESRPE